MERTYLVSDLRGRVKSYNQIVLTMKKSSVFKFFLFVLTLFFFGCGDKRTETQKAMDKLSEALKESEEEIKEGTKTGTEALTEAMDNLKETFDQNSDGEKVEPVNFRKLKELMPEKFAGLPRTGNDGETSGFMGFKISKAEADFQEDDKWVSIEINDVAGIGTALMGMAAWAMVDMDKESDDGYERSIDFEGHKAFEKFDSRNNSGELNILLHKRFIVNVSFRNLNMDQVKKELRRMDWDDLKDLT